MHPAIVYLLSHAANIDIDHVFAHLRAFWLKSVVFLTIFLDFALCVIATWDSILQLTHQTVT